MAGSVKMEPYVYRDSWYDFAPIFLYIALAYDDDYIFSKIVLEIVPNKFSSGQISDLPACIFVKLTITLH
jgi:hypothetical protein